MELALGRDPKFPEAKGTFGCAAAFWLRTHEDAWVADVPSAEALAAVTRDWPETYVELEVHPGMWLSQLHDQDSYSYVLALIYVGAASYEQLQTTYDAVVQKLDFDLRGSPDG